MLWLLPNLSILNKNVELFGQIFIDLHPNYVVQCVARVVLITQIILLMFHLSLSILFLPFELGQTSQSIDDRTWPSRYQKSILFIIVNVENIGCKAKHFFAHFCEIVKLMWFANSCTFIPFINISISHVVITMTFIEGC